MERLKQKIIPLLKNNRLLIDWFLQLFDSEKSVDIKENEHERVYYKYVQNNCDNESSHLDEILPFEDRVSNIGGGQQSCGLKYIDGKIIYRDRIVLPAKLSFMAYNGVVEDSDVETVPDDLEGHCMHDIRKYVKKHLEKSSVKSGRRKDNSDNTDREDEEDEPREDSCENGTKRSK